MRLVSVSRNQQVFPAVEDKSQTSRVVLADDNLYLLLRDLLSENQPGYPAGQVVVLNLLQKMRTWFSAARARLNNTAFCFTYTTDENYQCSLSFSAEQIQCDVRISEHGERKSITVPCDMSTFADLFLVQAKASTETFVLQRLLTLFFGRMGILALPTETPKRWQIWRREDKYICTEALWQVFVLYPGRYSPVSVMSPLRCPVRNIVDVYLYQEGVQ